MNNLFFIVLLAALLLAGCGKPEHRPDQTAGNPHRCAQCGMYTSLYPKWEQIVISDAADTLYFDGSKCMFTTLLDNKLPVAKARQILVKDYYTLKQIDGRRAFYVVGSDITGPMGHELIPFASEAAAAEFLSDHGGTAVLRFDQIDLEMIGKLAGGTQMK